MEDKYIILLLLLFGIILFLIIRYLIIRERMKSFHPKYHSREQVKSFNELIRAAGFAFDPRQNIFYSLQDCWQRDFGYRELYDEMSPTFNMVFDCEPIVFEYDGKRWMIEFWKGQYGITTGAEVGIYVGDSEKTYRCAKKNEEQYIRYHLWKGKRLLVSREQRGWWATSFILGEYTKPKQLSMTIDISFYDSEMSESFFEAMLLKGYTRSNLGIWGNTVRIRFDKPYSIQPASKTSLQAKIAMTMNRINCALFRFLTRKQICTLDKIEYIKLRFPLLYEYMMKVLYAWGKKNGRL